MVEQLKQLTKNVKKNADKDGEYELYAITINKKIVTKLVKLHQV